MDSMDRSKWALPRTAVLNAKEMDGLVRPKLDVTAVICHGHMCGIFFAEPGVVKGMSWTVELLANCFHILQAQGVDLRRYECILHGDNCSKEVKSNGVARYLALLVSRGRLRRAQLQTLVSGHSHEDVDAFFGLLGKHLETQAELHDAADFQQAIAKFLSNRSVRPQEPLRVCQLVSQIRDWTHGLSLANRVVSRCFVATNLRFAFEEGVAARWLSQRLLEGHGGAWSPAPLLF